MQGHFPINRPALIGIIAIISVVSFCGLAWPYKICTFKGVVIDHGWRTMTVKTGGQCAKVNVGWRTKYIPNRRPCLGETVAVDFILEEGYMNATKVVSLTPKPPEKECYPPPPPSSTRCKNVPGSDDTSCKAPKPVCSRYPPRHVSDPEKWSPKKSRHSTKKRTKTTRKPQAPKPQPRPKPKPKPPEDLAPENGDNGEDQITKTTPQPEYSTISGEVVASSPKSLSIRVSEDGGAQDVVSVKVGLKTKFIPFRRPAVGEKVEVRYYQENGGKFGATVKVIKE